MEKYSIVGLSLLAVSAITAAFAPSKASNSDSFISGIMAYSTGLFSNIPDPTCRELERADPPANCSYTETGFDFMGALSLTDPMQYGNSVSFANNTASGTTEMYMP